MNAKPYLSVQMDPLVLIGALFRCEKLDWHGIIVMKQLHKRTFAQLLRNEGYRVRDEDVARLSPFIHKRHINLLGRYSFAVPEAVSRGELRPLRNPDDPDA